MNIKTFENNTKNFIIYTLVKTRLLRWQVINV